MIRNFLRPADRAEEQGIMPADLCLPVFRHHVAMLGIIVIAGEIEMVEMKRNVEPLGRGLKCSQPLRNHFLANAVARNDRDIISVLRHVCSSRVLRFR